MAMGGLMKGHHHGSRGKPYGLMLLMAIVAAMIGVMVLHKLRDRRFFNLLVKEKDRDITTLQLLLQKERDHVRQAKWKLEEMKTKVDILRTQKNRLDSRILEMQSTIFSLREEQRTIELALEDKQNEIKVMRRRYKEVRNNSPQVKEIVRQRESEGADLTNQLETPANVWSDNSSEHADSGWSESENNKNEEQAAQGEHKGENGEDVESKEQIQKVDSSKESVLQHRSTYLGDRTDADESKITDKFQTGEALGMRDTNNTDKIDTVVNHVDEMKQLGEIINEGQTTEGKVLQATGIDLQAGTSNAQGVENQESGSNYKGGMKLEMPNSQQIGRHRHEGNGHLKKTKRKRWNIIHRSKESKRKSVSIGAAATNDKSFSHVKLEGERDKYGYQGELATKEYNKTVLNGSHSDNHDEKISNNLQTGEGSKLEINEKVGLEDDELQQNSGREKEENNIEESKDSPWGTVLLKPDKYQYAKDLSQEDGNTTTYLITEKRQIINETSITTGLEHISLKDTLRNTTIHIEDETTSEAKQQNQSESEESQIQATNFQQPEERIDDHKEDDVSEQTQTVNNDVEPENPEMENVKENPELEKVKGTESDIDASKESILNSEADGE